MDNTDFLAGRVRELSGKTYQSDYLTHTQFLSVSELADFYEILRKGGSSALSDKYNGVSFCTFGGYEDAERRVVCFLPSYLDRDSFIVGEQADSSVVACLKIEPVNKRFADELSHRDFLGSLMNLGIKRETIGDILTDSTCAYVYAVKDMAEYICKNLVRVKHTTVSCKEVGLLECTIEPAFEEVSGSVSSERLDAILSMVYHLARGRAKELIEAEAVFVDGRTAFSGGYDLKKGSRVSVSGHGKFIYEGMETQTRKGRLFVKARVYK